MYLLPYLTNRAFFRDEDAEIPICGKAAMLSFSIGKKAIKAEMCKGMHNIQNMDSKSLLLCVQNRQVKIILSFNLMEIYDRWKNLLHHYRFLHYNL